MRDREGEPEAADARPEESERERDKERLLHYTPSCLSVPYIPACVWPVYSPAIHKARTFVVFFSPPQAPHESHSRFTHIPIHSNFGRQFLGFSCFNENRKLSMCIRGFVIIIATPSLGSQLERCLRFQGDKYFFVI